MKYYVVWKGRKPGIYTSWQECEEQIKGYKGAIYKAFNSQAEAQSAFAQPPERFITKKKKTKQPAAEQVHLFGTHRPLKEAIAVDAACSGNPGMMEYRGVDLRTGQEVFHVGPLPDGTNNVGEFLAIVHALAWLKQRGEELPVYSDSATAINWVKQKKCNTALEPTSKNQKIFQLIQRAERWLEQNPEHAQVLKWDTEAWGEIPADFGRK